MTEFSSKYNISPSKPGNAYGMTTQQNKQFNIQTFRRKGFVIALAVNTLVTTPIQLIGTAKQLLGILVSMDDTTTQAQLTLTVDNDAKLNNVAWNQLSRDAARTFYASDYFPVPAFISGNSAISLEITSTIATTARVQFIFV